MKYSNKIFLFALSTILFSFQSIAADQGISGEDLKKLKLQTGRRGAVSQVADFKNRASAFDAVMQDIRKINVAERENTAKQLRLKQTKLALPSEFHHPDIVALAGSIRFADATDSETRASKFASLALMIRDMYKAGNRLSERLEISSDAQDRLHDLEITFLVVRALDLAIAETQKVETSIPQDRAIDFHISFAELVLWRLNNGQKSPLHERVDLNVNGKIMRFNDEKTAELKSLALAQLKIAQDLIRDRNIELPVIYHAGVLALARTLNAEQKYELAKMHKDEIDKKLDEVMGDDPRKFKERAGITANINPISEFFATKYESVVKHASMIGVTDQNMSAFMYRYMMAYVDKAVVKPEKYFTQDVLQRYLLSSGILRREMLEEILLEKLTLVEHAVDGVARIH